MARSIQGLLLALMCSAAGAGLHYLAQTKSTPSTPVDTSAKIVGPAAIAYAGQYAAYHVDVPGKNPASLIVTWSIESVTPIATSTPIPNVRPTGKPGEAQVDTVAGHWRLAAAIADPVAKSGQVCSIEICVPHEHDPPSPGPTPTPSPAPGPAPLPTPVPTPGPTPQPAPDSGKFSQFATDVAGWLSQVNSPDKTNEASLIAAGAAEVATSLRTGSLSKLSGLPLRIAVASAVMANNNKIKNATSWAAFGQNVNAAASNALKAGQLNTASDWADFLAAFERGLKT